MWQQEKNIPFEDNIDNKYDIEKKNVKSLIT